MKYKCRECGAILEVDFDSKRRDFKDSDSRPQYSSKAHTNCPLLSLLDKTDFDRAVEKGLIEEVK